MRTQLHNYTFVNDLGMALVVPIYGDYDNTTADAMADHYMIEAVADTADWWLDNVECAVCDKKPHK